MKPQLRLNSAFIRDTEMTTKLPPLNDGIVYALAVMVDDSQSGTRRDPSHGDLDFLINQCNLAKGDPKNQGLTVGKEKRLRATLSWALEYQVEGGQRFVSQTVGFIRSRGGFRSDSQNYVGVEAIRNLRGEFHKEGFELSEDGDLRPRVLDSLTGRELTEALQNYVRRAQKGSEDAALVTGTGKDLLEAIAAHVLFELNNVTQPPHNFPTLLGQSFITLGLKTSADKTVPGEPPHHRLQRGLFEAALAINTLRNKQGTGHGHPWLPQITEAEARSAIQVMGIVGDMMLASMNAKKS
jgi:hypothetical protein